MRTVLMAVMVALLASQALAQENPWRSPLGSSGMQMPYQYPSIVDYTPRMDFEPYTPYSERSGWMNDFGRPVVIPRYAAPSRQPLPSYQVPSYQAHVPVPSYQQGVTPPPTSSPLFEIPGFNAPLRDEGPSFYENFMREADAQHAVRSQQIMKAFRDTAPQRRRNALAVCAQYNRGCAKELWGMGD